MKSLSRINLIVILLLMSIFTNSQDNSLHHKKYWWYKSRLNNDFVKVGLGDGESLPFNQRGSGSTGFSGAVPNLKIGDGTSTLGLYIAQLATEYALLKKNQQNTNKVKHELFCALNAIDRLDYKAENIEEYGIYRLNGFFIRDDIPKNFTRINYNHFNYYSSWDGINTVLYGPPQGETEKDPDRATFDRGFNSKFDIAMFRTNSSWSARVDDGKLNELYLESQDQAYNLLFGLSFVNKFVDAGASNNNLQFPYTGITELRAQARNQAQRIIDYIRDPKDINGNDCNSSVWNQAINQWRVKNPTTCNLVSIGDDARAYAYALGEIECQITSDNYSAPNVSNLLGLPLACPGSGYHNAYSLSAGFTVWNAAATTPLYLPSNPSYGMDTRVFNTNLSAICNCVYGSVADQTVQQVITYLSQSPITSWFGAILGWVWKLISETINIFIPGKRINITPSAITTNAYIYGATIDHGPIAHALLHGYPTYIPNSQYSFDYLLDVAPCDGIYNLNNNQWGHFQWSSDTRCDHPSRIGTQTDFPGEYNGIDFMLYHNLYYLHKSLSNGLNVNMSDLSDIYINQSVFNNIGNVNAYETIVTENTTITANSPTAWRAGKTISFKPGTVITGNNNLHAYIQKFDCATDNSVFRMANTDTTNQNNSTNDSYEEGVRYHTVNYPTDNLNSMSQAVYNESNIEENLITELPVEEDPLDKMIKDIYPDYSKELFVKPTVTIDNIRAYFELKEDEIAFINVLDLNGKIIFNQNNLKQENSGLIIDLSDVSVGTYLLKFTTTSGTNKTQKIIKQ